MELAGIFMLPFIYTIWLSENTYSEHKIWYWTCAEIFLSMLGSINAALWPPDKAVKNCWQFIGMQQHTKFSDAADPKMLSLLLFQFDFGTLQTFCCIAMKFP